jgi:glycosyltransferase involved in cell wall biosynthesis
MRIALISTTHAPIDPSGGGSIEQVVWSLATELTDLGHDITVFGLPGAQPDFEVVTTWPGTYGEPGVPGDARLADLIATSKVIERAADFDVIHAHNYLTAVPLAGLVKTPMVHTLHVQPYDDEAEVLRTYPKAKVTALSRFQWRNYPEIAPEVVIPHGVSGSTFCPGDGSGGYLLYLGRFQAGKGAVAAAELARAVGAELILAGPSNAFFEEQVRSLVDGSRVRHVGAVGGVERVRLLQQALALIYPIDQGEPFGLVLIEAMMCGTPVIASPVGAVPEIVDHGVTGFLAADERSWISAIRRVDTLDRRAIGRIAEQRFSSRRMAENYLRIYESTLAGEVCLGKRLAP